MLHVVQRQNAQRTTVLNLVELVSPCGGGALLPQHPALAVSFLPIVFAGWFLRWHGRWNRRTMAPELSAVAGAIAVGSLGAGHGESAL